ncbi:hypothetical protein BDZ91DRAFT_710282, partial [Kalaharituber pfeilii]
MPSRHPHPTPPAWSVIGLISSFIVFFAIIVLANVSPFAGNVVGITYSCLISISCTVVVYFIYYPRQPTGSHPDRSGWPGWLVQTMDWLGVSGTGRSGSGRSEMSEGTRERLRIAAGGVVRAPESVGSADTTLPPYSPRRPERAVSVSGRSAAGSTHGAGSIYGGGAVIFPPLQEEFIIEQDQEDLWRNRPATMHEERGVTY